MNILCLSPYYWLGVSNCTADILIGPLQVINMAICSPSNQCECSFRVCLIRMNSVHKSHEAVAAIYTTHIHKHTHTQRIHVWILSQSWLQMQSRYKKAESISTVSLPVFLFSLSSFLSQLLPSCFSYFLSLILPYLHHKDKMHQICQNCSVY